MCGSGVVLCYAALAVKHTLNRTGKTTPRVSKGAHFGCVYGSWSHAINVCMHILCVIWLHMWYTMCMHRVHYEFMESKAPQPLDVVRSRCANAWQYSRRMGIPNTSLRLLDFKFIHTKENGCLMVCIIHHLVAPTTLEPQAEVQLL